MHENVASQFIHSLSRSRDYVLGELGRRAATLEMRPRSVVVFGSLARGEADEASDVDVLFVRPPGLDDDWSASLVEWRRSVRLLTGNRIEVLQADTSAVGRLLRSRKPLSKDIAQDGVVIFGTVLEQLKVLRSA